MLLERRTVSRKTAGDGKLEIAKPTAARLEALGTAITIEIAGDVTAATLGSMACTCRGADKPHVHHFLEAERLKQLPANSAVEIDLDVTTHRVRIQPSTVSHT